MYGPSECELRGCRGGCPGPVGGDHDYELPASAPVDLPNDRDSAIALIRAALRRRTGRTWSVTGGRGTAWGWIGISAPPARRTGGWREYMTDDDRDELARALDVPTVHAQGVSIPASGAYRDEYIDRAEGRTPRRLGEPRKRFEREPLEELAASIRSLGVLEPIVVQPWAGDPAWRIVAGERRWRAATMAGLAEVPCLIRDDLTDHTAFELSMVENVLRRDMNPMEEAAGYQLLLDAGLTVEELSARLGKRASAIRTALTLLKLEPGIADLVAKRHMTAWDGARLATLTWNGQARAFAIIERHGLTGNDRDRAIGQVWRDEHEQPMFSDEQAPVVDARGRTLTAELERAVRSLTRAVEALEGAAMIPDPLTVELAEQALRAASTIAKVTRQAKVARLLQD